MPAQSKRWCWTLNNPTQQEIGLIRDEDRRTTHSVSYLVFGREIGDNGTPHLQGYAEFSVRKRLATVKQYLGNRCHVEPARGRSTQAADYCKKDNDFDEYGQISASTQGKRSDIDAFVEWTKEFHRDNDRAPNDRDMANQFPSLYLRYAERLRELRRLVLPIPQLVDGDLNPWQQQLWDHFEEGTFNDREVIFIVDPAGGAGKSWFCRYCLTKRDDCQVLSVSKRDDVAHAIDENKQIFLFNLPRGSMEYLQYPVLEMMKDQMVFSPKYNSQTKILPNTPCVVVFTNEYPDMAAMTDDRYKIINP